MLDGFSKPGLRNDRRSRSAGGDGEDVQGTLVDGGREGDAGDRFAGGEGYRAGGEHVRGDGLFGAGVGVPVGGLDRVRRYWILAVGLVALVAYVLYIAAVILGVVNDPSGRNVNLLGNAGAAAGVVVVAVFLWRRILTVGRNEVEETRRQLLESAAEIQRRSTGAGAGHYNELGEALAAAGVGVIRNLTINAGESATQASERGEPPDEMSVEVTSAHSTQARHDMFEQCGPLLADAQSRRTQVAASRQSEDAHRLALELIDKISDQTLQDQRRAELALLLAGSQSPARSRTRGTSQSDS